VPELGRTVPFPEDWIGGPGEAFDYTSPSSCNAMGNSVEWDGRDDWGLPVPEGFYLFEVRCFLPASVQHLETGNTLPANDLPNVRVGPHRWGHPA